MKQPNTTNVLLAVVAVLLGLNLWHGQADAQPHLQVQARVSGMTVKGGTAFRVWSDGMVEWRGINPGSPSNGDFPFWYAGQEWAEVPLEQP